MKVCPVCKTTLFEDMEVCYGCLYRFGSEPALEKAASNLEELRRTVDHIPPEILQAYQSEHHTKQFER